MPVSSPMRVYAIFIFFSLSFSGFNSPNKTPTYIFFLYLANIDFMVKL